MMVSVCVCVEYNTLGSVQYVHVSVFVLICALHVCVFFPVDRQRKSTYNHEQIP